MSQNPYKHFVIQKILDTTIAPIFFRSEKKRILKRETHSEIKNKD